LRSAPHPPFSECLSQILGYRFEVITAVRPPAPIALCVFHEKVVFVKHRFPLSSLNPLFGADQREAAQPRRLAEGPLSLIYGFLFRTGRDLSRARRFLARLANP